jgi:rhombotail lipoprotein
MIALRIIAVALWLLTGCASSQGLHPEPLNELLRYEEQRFLGEQPPKTIATNPSGQTIPKLGLYLKPTGFLNREFEWTDVERETLLAWANGLRSSGLFSSASFVPQSSLRGNTLDELRQSAARYGADLLLIVDGAASVDRYNNYKASFLYWTILGAYLADGTHSDALCLLRGSLWEVKAGTQLFSDDAQGTAQQVGPAARIDDRIAVSQACRQAFTQLLVSMKNRVTHPQNP